MQLTQHTHLPQKGLAFVQGDYRIRDKVSFAEQGRPQTAVPLPVNTRALGIRDFTKLLSQSAGNAQQSFDLKGSCRGFRFRNAWHSLEK